MKSDSSKGLMGSISFSGHLSANGSQCAVEFQTKLDKSGKVVFTFDKIPLTEESNFILHHWEGDKKRFGDFNLNGMSDDGTTFITESLHFTSVGPNWNNEDGTFIKLDGNCSTGTFNRILSQPAEKPLIRRHLKGFRSFDHNHQDCDLGTVSIVGMTDFDDADKITGYITISPHSDIDDLIAWREQSERLLEHVRRIMSFASGTFLKSPITEFFWNDTVEVRCYSQTTQSKAEMPLMHFLNLCPIFSASITSYFHAPFKINNLFFSIEWFSMNATYSEIRLINMMTALENLIDSNLTEEEAFFFPKKYFAKKRSLINSLINDLAEDWTPEGQKQEFLEGLSAKLNDLNRKPLRNKLHYLANKWSVPIDDIPNSAIQKAITARNHVVHQGNYYSNTKDNHDLWDHFSLIREVVSRILMTAIGYSGEYISFYGGYHLTHFPPKRGNTELG